MKLVDPRSALFTANIPAGNYSTVPVYLPTLAHQVVPATIPTFDNGLLFDVSAWESWALFVSVNATNAILGIRYYDDPAVSAFTGLQNTQPIGLPSANNATVMIVGKVLGPLMVVTLTGTFADSFGVIELYPSNRPRIHDAPYTPAALGTILATIPKANIAALGKTTVAVPYYLGPARLGLYIAGASGGTPGAGAMGRVHDDGTTTAEITAAAVNAQLPSTDLWVPNIATTATQWQLSADNLTTATVGFAVALTAA